MEKREKDMFYHYIICQEDCTIGFDLINLHRVERVSVCEREREIERDF